MAQDPTYFYTYQQETLDRHKLRKLQRRRLRRMLEVVSRSNQLYRRKFRAAGWNGVPPLEEWQNFPFTTKVELCRDAEAHPPYGTNLTFPLNR